MRRHTNRSRASRIARELSETKKEYLNFLCKMGRNIVEISKYSFQIKCVYHNYDGNSFKRSKLGFLLRVFFDLWRKIKNIPLSLKFIQRLQFLAFIKKLVIRSGF